MYMCSYSNYPSCEKDVCSSVHHVGSYDVTHRLGTCGSSREGNWCKFPIGIVPSKVCRYTCTCYVEAVYKNGWAGQKVANRDAAIMRALFRA